MSLLLLLIACRKDDGVDTDPPVPDAPAGLMGDHLLNPFPVGALHTAGGQLSLTSDDFGLPDAISALPMDRLAWRTGFSPGQTSVIVLPSVNADALPGWRTPTPGEGGVRLADLTDGVWLPVMAELDAHPLSEVLTLLVRPQVAVPVGHEVAVVITTDVTPAVERFTALISGDPPEDLADHAASFEATVAAVEALGTPRADIAIAWTYPVGDGTLPMRSAWSQSAPVGTWSFPTVRELDAGDDVAPLTWRAAEGTYAVRNFLIDDARLDLAADGSVRPAGEGSATLYVHVPTSVKDAPAGTVPVLIFGHGIFGEPSRYLDDDEDGSRVLQLAEDAGFIVVGTEWRGLSYPDRLGAISVAQDFGRMHEITDRLVQGQANMAALITLMDSGALLDDPVFQGATGQSLPDRQSLRYYGISLGGIQGAVMLANDPPLDAAVLHVGGSTWSTMLERSSNWPAFEIFMDATIEDPLARQRLYALSQLWWDVADPIAYTAELSERSFLLQESRGDEQVPNMTTRALARSVGLVQLEPVVEAVVGLQSVAGPLPPGSRALVQFDPEVPLPADSNRPAEVTRAHDKPRTWAGTNHQTREFLAVGSEGSVVHHCGASPCAESNQGE